MAQLAVTVAKLGVLAFAAAGNAKALKAIVHKHNHKEPRLTGLLDLPREVLDTIMALLPTRDRFSLLVCCHRLYLLMASSASLWENLSVRLDSGTRLQQFVAAMRRPGVAQRLRRLRISPLEASTAWWTDSHVSSVVTALARAPNLEILDWTVPNVPSIVPRRTTRLGEWAGVFPHLLSLTLTSQGAQVELPASLGAGLPSLHQLCIYGDVRPGSHIDLEPGCLPLSLRRLEIYDERMYRLPPPVEAATQLTELCLWAKQERMDLVGLPRLTGLCRLALRNIPINRQVFDDVAELPRLESLDLSGGPQAFLTPTSCLAGLTQLLTLQELYLGGRGLQHLPEGLVCMPSLKVLHLEGNPQLKLWGVSAQTCQLQLLTLDAEAAVQTDNLRALASMAHLQRLHISDSRGAVPRTLLALVAGHANLKAEGVHLLPGPSSAWHSQQEARRKVAAGNEVEAWTAEDAARSKLMNSICSAVTALSTVLLALSELGIL